MIIIIPTSPSTNMKHGDFGGFFPLFLVFCSQFHQFSAPVPGPQTQPRRRDPPHRSCWRVRGEMGQTWGLNLKGLGFQATSPSDLTLGTGVLSREQQWSPGNRWDEGRTGMNACLFSERRSGSGLWFWPTGPNNILKWWLCDLNR